MNTIAILLLLQLQFLLQFSNVNLPVSKPTTTLATKSFAVFLSLLSTSLVNLDFWSFMNCFVCLCSGDFSMNFVICDLSFQRGDLAPTNDLDERCLINSTYLTPKWLRNQANVSSLWVPTSFIALTQSQFNVGSNRVKCC